METKIIKLSGSDLDTFITLIRLFDDVFELEHKSVPPAYLQELLNKDHFFVFVALDGTDVVGGLTAYALQQYVSVQPLMYVYDLAVKTEYQRLGIGKRLMGAIRHYSKEAGYEEVFVQAYAEEEQAVNFYHSSGATGIEVMHFSYKLK